MNYSLEFVHHGSESNLTKDPPPIIGNRTCMYKKRGYIPIASNDDQDLMARVCNLNIRVKFEREGAYKYEQKEHTG